MTFPERLVGSAGARLERYLGLGVALVSVAPRTVGFGEWWLNPDEGTYYAIFTRSSGVWTDIMENAHPPLYYLLVRVLGFVTHDFFWFRLPSLLCGAAAVYLIWLAARELAGPGVRGIAAGLVAALIVSFAPGAVELSKVVRPYTLQLALLAGSLWCLLRYLGTGSGRTLGWYVILICLGLLTHYSSVLALGAFVALAIQQGFEQRWDMRRWRRLALAHAVPGILLVGLYFFHMRHLVGSTLADAALDGWLSYYMVRSPAEAWVAFMGFMNLVGAPWLSGPLAAFFVIGLGAAAARRDWPPLLLGAAGLGVGALAAAVGLYPLGPSRHSLWLMVVVVPVVAWLAAEVVSLPRRQVVLASCAAATLLIGGETVGRWLGRASVPGTAPERVLRRADMESMQDLLYPAGQPRLVLMSRQTFYLLVPHYGSEWEDRVFSADGSVSHFRVGERDVVVASGWDLRGLGDAEGDASHLLDVLRTAEREFAAVDLQRDSTVLLLAGGWALPVVADLQALSGPDPLVLESRAVPGLVALVLDADAYRRIMRRTSG